MITVEKIREMNKRKVETMIPKTSPFERSVSHVVGKILFVGVGRCGGALANQMQKRGFEAFYINTALGDFQNLPKVTPSMIYQIPKGSGCDKDRDLALTLVKDYAGEIANTIRTNYANYKHIIFLFSTGGGTGSGVAPALAQYLALKHKMNTSLVGVLNSKHEGRKATENSLDCLQQIYNDCKAVKSKFIIDNSNIESKTEINEQFADILENLLLITKCQPDYDETHIKAIDQQELMGLLGIEGFVHVAKINAPSPTAEEGDKKPYHIEDDLPIFAEYNNKAVGEEMAVSISYLHGEDLSPIQLKRKYGIERDIKVGYNRTETSLCYIFGLPKATETLKRLDSWLDEFDKKETEKQEEIEEYIPKNRTSKKDDRASSNDKGIDIFDVAVVEEAKDEIDELLFSDFIFS